MTGKDGASVMHFSNAGFFEGGRVVNGWPCTCSGKRWVLALSVGMLALSEGSLILVN